MKNQEVKKNERQVLEINGMNSGGQSRFYMTLACTSIRRIRHHNWSEWLQKSTLIKTILEWLLIIPEQLNTRGRSVWMEN